MTDPGFYGPLLQLRAAPLLAGLPAPDVAAVARHVEETFVPKGTRFLPDEAGRARVFLISSGSVEARLAGSGRRLATAGDAVGLLEGLCGRTAELGATALTDAILLALEWEVLLDLWERHFLLVQTTLRGLASQPAGRTRLAMARAYPSQPGSMPSSFGSFDLAQRTLLFRESGVFPPDQMEGMVELAEECDVVRLESGERVDLGPGGVPDRFLLVCAGGVAQLVRSVEVPVAGALQTIGLLELLAEEPLHQELIATGPTLALSVARNALFDALDDHFELTLGMMARLSRAILDRVGAAPVEQNST